MSSSPRPARWLQQTGYLLAGVGVFFGFLLGIGSVAGQRVLCASLAAVGLLAFIRHNVTAASDAIRLGFDGGHRGFQYEVGFANLAFAVPCLVVAFVDWGAGGRLAALLTFSVYLLSVAAYHALRTVRGELRGANAVIAVGASGSLAAILLIAVGVGVHGSGLWPF